MTKGTIIAVNNSSQTLNVFVSTYSNKEGDDSWYTIEPSKRLSWIRYDWECIAFKTVDGAKRSGAYVPLDSKVTFVDFDKIIVS